MNRLIRLFKLNARHKLWFPLFRDEMNLRVLAFHRLTTRSGAQKRNGRRGAIIQSHRAGVRHPEFIAILLDELIPPVWSRASGDEVADFA